MVAKFRWFLFVGIFCSSFYFNSAEDDNEIKLTLSWIRGNLKCAAPPLVNIEVGKQFRIFVDPAEITYFHTVRMCSKSLESNESVNTQFWKEDPFKRYGYSSNKFNATKLGDWNYECVFFTKPCTSISSTNKCSYNDGYRRTIDGIKCFTKVHVYKHGEIVVQPSSYLSVNAVNFTSMEGAYKFYDAEGTNFTCHKTAGSYLKLTYTLRTGQQICTTGFERSDSLNMYIKLNEIDYGNILSCVATDDQYSHEYGVNLRLEKRATQDMLTFEVNGLILPLTKQTNNTDYYYEYKYYHGEKLTVGVVKDHEAYGDVRCSADGARVPVQLNSYFQNTSMSIDSVIFIIKQEETGTSLTCTVLRKRVRQELHIILTFLFHLPNYSPYISGLSMSNVVLQYSNETSNTIEYSIGRETLVLECLTSAHNLRTEWTYNPGVISSWNVTHDSSRVSRSFQLHHNQTQTTIKCQVNSTIETKTTYLQLIRSIETAIIPVPKTTSRGTISSRPTTSTTQTTTTSTTQTTTTSTTQTTTTTSTTQQTTTSTTPRTTVSSSSTSRTTTTIRPTVSKQERQDRVLKNKKPQTTKRKKIVGQNAPTARPLPTTKKPNKLTVISIKNTTIPAKSTPTLAVESTIHNANSSHSSTAGQLLKPSPNSVKPTNIPATETRETPAVGGITAKIADQTDDHTPSSDGNASITWMIVAGVVFFILVVAFILWLAFRKKKQILKHSTSNMDYQNLPAHHEGPMATPAQWDRPDDALYANPNSMNNLYANPTPKSQRNKTEPTYADPRDSIMKHTYINNQQINNEPSYASVQDNEPTYASVQNNDPTYASVQNNGPTYASVQNNDPTYASVQKNGPTYMRIEKSNNAQSDPTYANQKSLEYQNLSTLKKEDTYAVTNKNKSVRNSDSPYNNDPKSHYQNQGNVINEVIYTDVVHGKYVNADVKNEVEPAYCEVMKKK